MVLHWLLSFPRHGSISPAAPYPLGPKLQVCKEAEITVVVKQSEEEQPTEYLLWGKPRE